MFDIFFMEDVRKLMKKKSVVFLGDSNVRALYKDFLCLLQNSKLISDHILRTKMEDTVFGDRLVYHGKKTNARCYREEREASIENTDVSFFFLTKIYDDYVKQVLDKITKKSNPDVIIVNSCLWDITRWGCDGVKHFKENLKLLMEKFKILFPKCLIIWLTAPPIAAELKGGFLVKELQFLKYSLRFHVVEANHYARKMVIDNGFDVLDTHYHLQMQIHRRKNDGIHWSPDSVRYITNLILRHISLSWDIELPHRYKPIAVGEDFPVSEDIINPITAEDKENMSQICQRKSAVSSECSENMKNTASKQYETKDRNYVPLHKVPRKETGIHSHMANKDRNARKKRIREWKQYHINNPQAICNPTVTNSWAYPAFNDNFQTYDTVYHPPQRFTHENFPENPSHIQFSSSNFNHLETNFNGHFANNYSNPCYNQNYYEPYAFPPVAPGQFLQPDINFSNEVPHNFHY